MLGPSPVTSYGHRIEASTSANAMLISASCRVASTTSDSLRSRPDRLAHEPAAGLLLQVGPVADLGDDPGRIATELAHVEEPDPIRRVTERLTQRLDLLARDRDHQRLAHGIAGVQELSGAGQKLIEVAVEERPVLQPPAPGVMVSLGPAATSAPTARR